MISLLAPARSLRRVATPRADDGAHWSLFHRWLGRWAVDRRGHPAVQNVIGAIRDPGTLPHPAGVAATLRLGAACRERLSDFRAMTDEMLRERPVGRQTVFQGRLLTVHSDTVETAAGQRAGREIVDHPGAVGIVAADGHGRVILVRQWRHAVGRALWEIPAGTLARGEPPESAARRELAEETGYTASSWSRLGSGPVAPGYSGEILHLFAARHLSMGEPHPDPDEHVVARLFTVAEMHRLIAEEAVDIKTIAGLALAGFAVSAEPLEWGDATP